MKLEEFHQALIAALGRHLPQARVRIAENRGIRLTGQVELTSNTLIAVYFNALTGKTSYALIHKGRRVAGCDNYRFWHRHPVEAPGEHVPCVELSPEDAIAELAAASKKLG